VDVVFGHPFKKRDHLLWKHGFRIQDSPYFLQTGLIIPGDLFQDIAVNLSIIEWDQNPAPYLGPWRQTIGDCIGEGFFDRKGDRYSQAGQVFVGQLFNPY
jgi:hypothetical protein